MQSFEWVHAAWLIAATALEIAANIFLKHSDGFRRWGYGVLSLLAVLAAFSALGQAVKGIELSVAYALWGGSVSPPPSLRAGYFSASASLAAAGWG